jgi:CRP-like cAMP-binding protein
VRLLDVDPALGKHLSSEGLSHARRHALVDTRTLAPGGWEPLEDPLVPATLFGLLLLDGALTRRAGLGRRASIELIGPGDLIRPQQPDPDPYAIIPQTAAWRVLEPTTVAVLDDDQIAGLGGLRGVAAELAGRAIQRVHAGSLRMAIAQVPTLEHRLHLLLWHLADRWGRRSAGAVALTVRLPHEVLAELVSAQRSSVGPAIRRLEAQGIIVTRPDGRLELRGDPPGDLLLRI